MLGPRRRGARTYREICQAGGSVHWEDSSDFRESSNRRGETENPRQAKSVIGTVAAFVPKLKKGPKGHLIMDKGRVTSGPKSGAVGLLDDQGRIWVRDEAHAGYPLHWDVQVNGGADYFRVGLDGNPVTPAK